MKYSRTDIARGFVKQLDEAGVKKAVQQLAAVLLEQRMHNQLDEILEDVSREYARAHGVVEATAVSAFPLSAEIKKELIARVAKKTGAKKVTLTEEIDRSLLGGVVVTAPDMELDLSLKTKLAKLKI